MSIPDINVKNFEKMDAKDKIKSLISLRDACLALKTPTPKGTTLARNFVCSIYPPIVRRYEYKTIGEENIPDDGQVIFMCNHSNSHDFFTSLEGLRSIGLESTVFAADDDLDGMTKMLFSACNATLADRRDKESTNKGLLTFCSKILGSDGIPGVMHGEATWNIHPIRMMQDLKIGGVLAAAITEKPIIPTIYEYVEVPEVLDSESKLYSKCIIKFLYPFYVNPHESLVAQTKEIQSIMESARARLKIDLGTFNHRLQDVNPEVYLNHVYLKKFAAFGFTYDSKSEANFLFSKDGRVVDNEYRMDNNGLLVPGITEKEEGKRFLPKKKY